MFPSSYTSDGVDPHAPEYASGEATTTAFIYVRKLGDNDMKFKYRRDATTVSAEDYLYAPSCEEESDELFKRFSTLRAIR